LQIWTGNSKLSNFPKRNEICLVAVTYIGNMEGGVRLIAALFGRLALNGFVMPRLTLQTHVLRADQASRHSLARVFIKINQVARTKTNAERHLSPPDTAKYIFRAESNYLAASD
jgi:hypothetical protein